ncbi:MAG TPA: tetratricopeptide repeat protein [Labilithrix sp.]
MIPRDETAFFGRAGELADLEARLAKARLVTVVGLGGIGKTRLALEAAERFGRKWEGKGKGGVVFVPLADAPPPSLDEARAPRGSVADASSASLLDALEPSRAEISAVRALDAAARALASAVGVRLVGGAKAADVLAKASDALATRGPTLVVLDGCEVIGGAGRELAVALLDRARDVSILATSREPLGAKGEEKLLLAPLEAADARALFLDRAQAAAGKAIAIDEGVLGSIVEQVDSLPLAIELAASRLELLTPEELLTRLGARIDVLADPSGKSDRQATMRATLDASWEMLSRDEREVLAEASVFAAPFGIEAAEEIVQLPSPGRPDGPGEVLDVVESLLRKSLLVRAESRGRARLRMYETVRAWARGKLVATGAEAEVRARHAAWHLAEAEKHASKTYGDGAVRALDGLAEILPELLGAFDATKTSDPRIAARIVLSLTDLLLFRGLFELRGELFAAGVAAAVRAGDERLLARALVAQARVTLELGNMADAEAELRRALDLATRAGDAVTVAEATRSLGWLLTATNRPQEADAALAQALAMHREQGSARGEADARVATGILRAFQGKRDEALAHLSSALEIHVATGDVIRQEKVLGFAALVGLDAKDVARGLPREVLARAPASSIDMLPAQVAEAVAGQREAGARWREAIELYQTGVAAHERGAAQDAVVLFEKALAALARAGVTRGVAAIVAHTAAALAETGDLAEADARLARARKAAGDEPGGERVVEVLAAAVAVQRTRPGGDAREETLRACREVLDRASETEGAPPELAVARRTLARALDRAQGAPATASTLDVTVPAGALVVGRDARWIQVPGGPRVDLVRYGPVRRLLDRLVAHRLEHAGDALTAEQLIEAGWPGERMRHTAGLLRVYSAVRRLRRLGLEPVLVTRDDGYLLDPNAPVARADA